MQRKRGVVQALAGVPNIGGLERLQLLTRELDVARYPRGFQSRELEAAYTIAVRERRARSRIAMFLLATVMFGLAPLYGEFLLHTPDDLKPLYRFAEFGVIVPFSLLGILLNWRRPLGTLAEVYTAMAAYGFAALLISLRYIGLQEQFAIPFETVAIVMIIITLMSGLPSWQTLTGLIIVSVALVTAEAHYIGIGVRFWWSVLAMLVTLVFAGLTETSLDRATRRAWLARQVAQLTGMRDGLTGLPNRAWFEIDAVRSIGQAQREKVEVAVLLMDLDHFKQLNDSAGHAAGDDCLRAVGRLLIDRYALRPLDLRARIGGEEFVLLLYGIHREDAERLAAHLVNDVRRLAVPNPGSPQGEWVTASVGLSHGVPASGEDVWQLVSRADKALYEAKRGGRDRWSG